ncbi:MAG: glycosyltransferase family 4 protein [Spirochaetia bacterium]|nr:glycosyltransferase family 4 protein [Spirochaetia bacterium]
MAPKRIFKKIAIVTPYYYPLYGGVQEYVFHLKEEYKKLGYKVKVITGHTKKEQTADEHDVLRFGKSVPFSVNGSTGQIIMMRKPSLVKQALAREKFDIIHLQEPFVPFLSHTIINNSDSVNIATFHANFGGNAWYRLGSSFLKPLWKRLDAKIAVSPSAKASINRYFQGHDVEVIPNGVDIERFSPRNNKPLEKYSDGKLNILFAGRIEKRKGLIYLIKAYQELKKQYPGIRLIVVGHGPLLKDHRKYIIKHRVRGIHFEGFVSTKILPRYFATADIFCSPALFGESFGIVLLEAMAAGKPVVAFNISGYRDVVDNGANGLLAEPKNVHDLAKKLETLICDYKLRSRLGSAGLKKSRRFTWKRIAARNIALYEKTWKRVKGL